MGAEDARSLTSSTFAYSDKSNESDQVDMSHAEGPDSLLRRRDYSRIEAPEKRCTGLC